LPSFVSNILNGLAVEFHPTQYQAILPSIGSFKRDLKTHLFAIATNNAKIKTV